MSKKEVSMSVLVRDLANADSDVDIRSTDLAAETAWGSFKRYLYNSSDGTCCQRTSSHWMMLLLYYIGYTAFIIALYLAFVYGCALTIRHLYPNNAVIDKEILLYDAHPGFGFVPNIEFTKYPIIWYSSDPPESKTEEVYINALDKFFTKYKEAKRDNYIDCSKEKKGDKPCYFDLGNLKDCVNAGYQYTNSSLCFFLKLNKRKHWKPINYKQENDFPDEMSQSMMDHILASSNKDVVYVECRGENLWDNEHLGEITYYPKQGFDGFYFPYEGESEFLSPLVAVKMSGVTTGVVVHIKCTVWAKNIGSKLNTLHFKVFIDNTMFF